MSNIKDSWAKIEPDEEARKRMLNNVLRLSHRDEKSKWKAGKRKWAAAFAALVLAAGIFGAWRIFFQATAGTTTVGIEIAENLDATLYIPNADDSALTAVQVRCKSSRPDGVLESLADYRVLPSGLQVNRYTVHDDGAEYSDGLTTAKVCGTLTGQMDLPGSFMEYLNGLTEEREKIVTASLAVTFLRRDNLATLQITIDGKPFVTNRADHSAPMRQTDFE